VTDDVEPVGELEDVVEPGAELEPDAVAPVVAPTHSRFSIHFAVIYGVLISILACAVAGLIVLATQPGKPKPGPWSSWRPAKASTKQMSTEIINHISRQYRLNAKGDQLVAVFPTAPELTQKTDVVSISTIAIQRSATSTNVYTRVLPTSGMVQQQYCGLGNGCSITGGVATSFRERLVRREALEIALYTFKYVPSVHSIMAFMPPPPGDPPQTMLFLERDGLSEQLAKPLRKTLSLATPPLPSSPDNAEAATVDKLTLPIEYGFQYAGLANKTFALILIPQT
jgi:hypothetical protein